MGPVPLPGVGVRDSVPPLKLREPVLGVQQPVEVDEVVDGQRLRRQRRRPMAVLDVDAYGHQQRERGR